ncbi:hypothetical protein FQN54_001262 [Arachnomyces sp. PD_36]|nr:hypothetical protein FQN54_001262 [Arachnomyces sp. PD_36]
MASPASRKSSHSKPSGGFQTPTRLRNQSSGSADPPPSLIPVRKGSATPKSLRTPLRSLLPDSDNRRSDEDNSSISSLAMSTAMHSLQGSSQSSSPASSQDERPPLRRKSHLPSVSNSSVRSKKDVARKITDSIQRHVTAPANLEQSKSEHHSKIPLRPGKSAQPLLRIPCAINTNPKNSVSPNKAKENASTGIVSQPSGAEEPQSLGDKSPERDATTGVIPSPVSPCPPTPLETKAPGARNTNYAQTPSPEITSLIYSLEHFNFFCLLDSSGPGKPVASSEFLWGSTQLQEKLDGFYAMALQKRGKVCEMIADEDSEGNEKSYLVLVDDFRSVAKGRQDHSIACVIDVTSFIGATIPGDLAYEPKPLSEFLVNNFLSATPSEEERLKTIMSNSGEARAKNSIARRERRALRLKHYLTKNTENPSVRSDDLVDRTITRFTETLLEFYTDYFMLARCPDDEEYYEMTHVSGNIHRKREYLDGHLTHSSREVFRQVRKALGKDERFTIRVRWGEQPVEKRLYCVPLIDPKAQGWICLLVDPGVPLLWHTSYRGYFG